VRAGDGNFLGEFDAKFVFEGVDFPLQLLLNLCDRVRHSVHIRQRKMMRSPDQPNSARNIIDGREIGGQGESARLRDCAHIYIIINKLDAFRLFRWFEGHGF
jgi:hypothetical protein